MSHIDFEGCIYIYVYLFRHHIEFSFGDNTRMIKMQKQINAMNINVKFALQLTSTLLFKTLPENLHRYSIMLR